MLTFYQFAFSPLFLPLSIIFFLQYAIRSYFAPPPQKKNKYRRNIQPWCKDNFETCIDIYLYYIKSLLKELKARIKKNIFFHPFLSSFFSPFLVFSHFLSILNIFPLMLMGVRGYLGV